MHKDVLFLSHWDASIPVRVPENVLKDLRNYHVMGVRFLYDCFRKGQKGAVLNHENGMNPQIQVSAFFNALNNFITPRSPILVVCCEDDIKTWHYHLTHHGGYDVTLLSPNNYEEILQGKFHRVVLSTVDNVKLLREIKETDFLSVVIDDLDEVATKTVIKQLKSQFNIGLTYRNFLKNPDQKLFWTMLNWSNSGVLGKFTQFCSEDDDHLANLRNPYGAWWQRLTWKFCDSFKRPTEHEEEQYRTALRNWSRSHGAYHVDLPKPVKRPTRKRTAKADPVKEEPSLKQEEDEADSDLPKPEVKRQTRKRAVKSKSKVKQEDDEALVEPPKLETKRQTRKRAASPKYKEDKNDSSDDLPELTTRRQTRKRAAKLEPSPQHEDENNSSDDLPEIKTRRQTRKRQVKSVVSEEVPDIKQKRDFQNSSNIAEPEMRRQTRKSKERNDDVQNLNKTECSSLKTSKNTKNSQDLNSSQETVIYDSEDDVLSSIMTQKMSKNSKNLQNLGNSEDTIIYDFKDNTDDELESSKEKVLSMLNEESNDSDDVLMSIMDTKSIKNETSSEENRAINALNNSQPKSKDSEILSLLYGDTE